MSKISKLFSLLIILIFYFIIFKIENKENQFQSKLLIINKNFQISFKQSINCLYKECYFKCLIGNYSEEKWIGYKDSDIPGPFPYEYPYLKNTEILCNKNVTLFISVISSCNQLEERMAVRKVYDKIDSSIQFHFFIGYTSIKCQKQFEIENEVFNDMSQMPIQESFANETIFTLYLHKILPIICPFAEYYGKMDVDQYINYPMLMRLLKEKKSIKKYIYVCHLFNKRKINTNQNYKYSSSKSIENYYNKVIPKKGFTGFTGSFTLWPSFLSSVIYQESLNETNIIRMDDQHIAWLVYRLNMKNMNISYYNLNCHKENYKKYCTFPYESVYGIHRLKGKILYSLNKILVYKNNYKYNNINNQSHYRKNIY